MAEKRRAAAALHYDPQTGAAPKVVASGLGSLAERIVQTAREAGVPVYEDQELARLLVGLDLEQEIPVELYRAVAAVLAVVFSVDQKNQLEEK